MSALAVVLTWNADKDLHSIWMHIAKNNPSAADRVIQRINQKFQQLGQMPSLGERQLRFSELMRRVSVGKYLIFYEPHRDAVIIARVIHAARRWEDLI
jgi:toxin ParE1/3/4